MCYIKEMCVELVTYQKFYRVARSAKYKRLGMVLLQYSKWSAGNPKLIHKALLCNVKFGV